MVATDTINSGLKSLERSILKEIADREQAITSETTSRNTAITNAINLLDAAGSQSIAANKTISSWTETDGIISIDVQDIKIASNAITDLTDTYSSIGTTVVNGKAIANAFTTLTAEEVKDGQQPIIAIKQENGVISATLGTISRSAITGLGSMADESTNDYTKTVNLGTMAFANTNDYTKTAGLGSMAFASTDDYTKTINLGSMAFEAANTYLTIADASSTYVTLTTYNAKIAELEAKILELENLIKGYHEEIPEVE